MENGAVDSLIRKISKPWLFKLYLLKNLPIGFVSGLRIEELSKQRCSISVPYKWLNKNPFRSVYFAVLNMAAEVSTGVLGMLAIYQRNPSVSMLVINAEGTFLKKATGKISFTCENGNEIFNTVNESISTGESRSVKCFSEGKDKDGNVVAKFYITWSFKPRK